MKKFISKIIMMIAIAISFSAAADAQLVVRIRPTTPVLKVRIASPSPRHVWVGGEWNSDGGNYSYKEGYWSEPPVRGNRWVEGHWRNTRRGYSWIPGHWK